MKFITVTFDYGFSTVYNTLSNVLIYSIIEKEPNASWIKYTLNEPRTLTKNRSYISNTVKLKYWVEEINKAKDGDELIFIDCDTVILKSVKDIFDKNFDIVYTIRTSSKYPLNGGVIFVRVNDRSRKFFHDFEKVNNQMLNDQEFHSKWNNKYAGINQAAFGYCLERKKSNVKILPVKCKIWNACNEDWDYINDETRILHLKGPLRKAVFGDYPIPRHLQKAGEEWIKIKDEWEKERIDY